MKVTIHEKTPFLSTTTFLQLGYGLWVNLIMINLGLSFGFSATTIPQLKQPDSDMKPTLDEIALITSVVTLFSPIGCIISGILLDRYGRRITLFTCQVPMIVGWLCCAFSSTIKDLIAGRTVIGIGVGMTIGVSRIYSSEITLPEMRGVVGAFSNLGLSVGFVVQACLGQHTPWRVSCYTGSIFSTLVCLSFVLIPETPYFLLLKYTDIEHAKQSLRKFRGKKYDITDELKQLQDFKTENEIRRLSLWESIKALFTPSSCKPFCIMVPYMLLAQLAGISVVMFYAVEILEDSNSSVDPETGNVILSVTRLVSAILMSMLIYKAGRRTLALTSCLGCSISCVLLTIYIKYYTMPSVIPQILFMVYSIAASMGYYPLPILMMFELYPLQIRGLMGGITVSLLNMFMFGSNLAFPFIRNQISLKYTLLCFATASFICWIFVLFYLPETKKLKLHEIEEYYKNRRSTFQSSEDIKQQQMTTLNIGGKAEHKKHSVDQLRAKNTNLNKSDTTYD